MMAAQNFHSPVSPALSPISTPFRIFSLNCRGLHQTKRRLMIFNLLCNLSFDIIFLQETHAPTNNNWKQEWMNISGGEAYFPKAKNNSSAGVAILFNKSFQFKEKSVIADPDGHYISICLSQQNFHFQLINIYGPNSNRENFYERLDNIIPFSGPLIVGGDFNFTEKPIDREGERAHEREPDR